MLTDLLRLKASIDDMRRNLQKAVRLYERATTLHVATTGEEDDGFVLETSNFIGGTPPNEGGCTSIT
jgi:hypothetical protein